MAVPKHIPGVKPARWWTKKWVVEAVGSVPPLGVAGVAAYRLAEDPATLQLAYFSATAVAWLLVASIIKVAQASSQDKDTLAKNDHDGLRAALWVLQASVGRICGLDPQNVQNSVRVTFHRVVPPLDKPEQIEQIVPYVGGAGNGAGRIFSVRSGITGRCIRTKEPHTMHRQNDDIKAYRKALESEWGYTEADAKQLSTDRLSSMAVPVLDTSGHHAIGVIYLDGTPKDLFTDQKAQSSIIEACAGVARYVSERYGK